MLRLRILTFPIISVAFCPPQPTPIEATGDCKGILCSSSLDQVPQPKYTRSSKPFWFRYPLVLRTSILVWRDQRCGQCRCKILTTYLPNCSTFFYVDCSCG